MSPLDRIEKLRALDKRPKWIVLDLDGTLIEQKWPELGDWLPGAQDAIRAFQDAGYIVKIHTTRLHSYEVDIHTERDLSEWQAEVSAVRKLLVDAGLEDVEILLDNKPPAVYYIDDKAIEFKGNWRKIVAKVLS